MEEHPSRSVHGFGSVGWLCTVSHVSLWFTASHFGGSVLPRSIFSKQLTKLFGYYEASYFSCDQCLCDPYARGNFSNRLEISFCQLLRFGKLVNTASSLSHCSELGLSVVHRFIWRPKLLVSPIESYKKCCASVFGANFAGH